MLDLTSSADDIVKFARNERGAGDLLRIRLGHGPDLGKHSVLYTDPQGGPLSAQISEEAFRELEARRLVVRDSEYGIGNPYTLYRLLI